MDRIYRVFGLYLHANRSIPGLEPTECPGQAPDVEIQLGLSPGDDSGRSSALPAILTYASSNLAETGDPALRIWTIPVANLVRMNYFDGVTFWLDRDGSKVWALWPDTSSLEDAATYFLGPVLGLLLRLRGVTCLHASAVAFRNSAVAFAGPEGAGKSTTAAALARRGHAVISDDIVALLEREGAFFALPAYPYLSLWPESVDIVYGPGKSLPCFSANYDKRQLALAENRLKFEEQPLLLGAVFLLGERSSDAEAPFVETLSEREALLELVANSYANNLLDKDMRASEFELLGRLVAAVPVRRLRSHEDPSRMDRLCDVILETRVHQQVSHARGC